jgi:hypothetical protein
MRRKPCLRLRKYHEFSRIEENVFLPFFLNRFFDFDFSLPLYLGQWGSPPRKILPQPTARKLFAKILKKNFCSTPYKFWKIQHFKIQSNFRRRKMVEFLCLKFSTESYHGNMERKCVRARAHRRLQRAIRARSISFWSYCSLGMPKKAHVVGRLLKELGKRNANMRFSFLYMNVFMCMYIMYINM